MAAMTRRTATCTSASRTCACRNRPWCSVAAAASTDAAPIELSAASPAGAGLNPGLVALAAINVLTGAQQALDHISLRQGHLEVANEGLAKTSVYEDLTLTFDKSGAAAEDYASGLVAKDVSAHADGGVLKQVLADFTAAGVAQSDHQIARHFGEFRAQAEKEIAGA